MNFRTICPHCKQEMREERAGVRLPPLKAHIFDVIRRAGRSLDAQVGLNGAVK